MCTQIAHTFTILPLYRHQSRRQSCRHYTDIRRPTCSRSSPIDTCPPSADRRPTPQLHRSAAIVRVATIDSTLPYQYQQFSAISGRTQILGYGALQTYRSWRAKCDCRMVDVPMLRNHARTGDSQTYAQGNPSPDRCTCNQLRSVHLRAQQSSLQSARVAVFAVQHKSCVWRHDRESGGASPLLRGEYVMVTQACSTGVDGAAELECLCARSFD